MLSAQVGSKETERDVELMLFAVRECYVYIIPPRRTAAAHRADDWNINDWAWEGAMKITVRGGECTIRLEDKITGELYAQAPLRADQPLPVEAVVDSSRFFVLRIEDSSSTRTKHAFVGVGFRERAEAYDFQAALYDHVKYLDRNEDTPRVQVQSQTGMTSPQPRIFDENFDISFLKKALAPPRLPKGSKPASCPAVVPLHSCTKAAVTVANAEPTLVRQVPVAGVQVAKGGKEEFHASDN